MGGRGASSSTRLSEEEIRQRNREYLAKRMEQGREVLRQSMQRDLENIKPYKDNTNRTYDGKIQLQSVGQVDARRAGNLKVGDIIMYNFGSTDKITKIEPSKTGKTFNVTTKSSESGYIGERKYGADRLVGIAEVEAKNYQEQRLLAIRKGKRR